MKRILMVLSLVMVLCMALVVPAMAVGPGVQTWQLDSTVTSAGYEMEKNGGPNDNGQTGQVPLGTGQSAIWIADQVALADVTFSEGAWIMEVATDADWGTDGDLCDVEIGQWDGTTFVPLATGPYAMEYTIFPNPTYNVVKYVVQTGAITVQSGNWLAVKITNNSNLARIVYTGEGQYASCLSSPNSDPGYPLPELATAILLGAGVLGLGGFIMMRRRKAALVA